MVTLTLKRKFLAIISLSILTMFSVCLYFFLESTRTERANIRREWLSNANNMNLRLGAQFFERYGDVQAFAVNQVLLGKNPKEISEIFNKYVDLYEIYDFVLFVDTKGDVIASSNVDSHGHALDTASLSAQNFARSPWFIEAMNERYSEDAEKGLSGSFVEDVMIDPITSRVYQSPRLGMSFSAPVRDSAGKIVGVISNRASLKWIEHEIKDTYEDLSSRGLVKSELNLINKRGEVFVDYEPSVQDISKGPVHNFDILMKLNLMTASHPAVLAASRGETGIMIVRHDRTGIDQVNAYVPIKDEKFLDELGWKFLMRVDEASLFERTIVSERTFLVSCSLVLFACLAFAAYFASQISRRLRDISEGIAQSGEKVDYASTQLSAASQDLSSGATEVASALEETVSSLEELTSMVKLNAENAGEASSLAQSSSRTAQDGEIEVQKLIGAIGDINQGSKKIEEIIGVIDDIAFQTNLLALNAAVEAARAGDQGRGFAVVAEAVRTLAQRSGTAAKEIGSLIRNNVEKIDRGTKIADRSGVVLQDILASARKVADLTNQIAAASKEQSTGLTQISASMNEIDGSTQRNAAASEEIASSSQEMKGQANRLSIAVHQLSELVVGQYQTGNAGEQEPVMEQPDNVTPLKTRRPGRMHSGKKKSDEDKPRLKTTAGF